MTLINLTPHLIRIYKTDSPDVVADPVVGLVTVIPPSGTVARLSAIDLGTWGSARHGDHFVPVEGVEYGHPEGLPAKTGDDKRYVVSLAFALAIYHREDLLVPYWEVRNPDGAVIGCRLLARVVG